MERRPRNIPGNEDCRSMSTGAFGLEAFKHERARAVIRECLAMLMKTDPFVDTAAIRAVLRARCEDVPAAQASLVLFGCHLLCDLREHGWAFEVSDLTVRVAPPERP